MENDFKNSKIVFIDDDPKSVEHYVKHLKLEGYSNTHSLRDVCSFDEAFRLNADLIFLDITGVGHKLDADQEGASVLSYFKKHRPWIPIAVLSGQEFDVEKIPDLRKADKFVRKASMSNSQLVNLTEDLLEESLSPCKRNPKILRQILDEIDDSNLGIVNKFRLRRAIKNSLPHENDGNYDWESTINFTQSILSTSANLSTVASFLLGK